MAVTIRNKRTGEVKVVQENELPDYLPSQTGGQTAGGGMTGGAGSLNPLVLQYLMQGISKAGSTAGGRYLTQAQTLQGLLGETETAEMQNRKISKSEGQRILKVFEDSYFLGQRGPLAYGTTGVGGRATGFAEELKSKYSADYNPELASYMALLESSRPLFAKAAGDVGNMSEAEQQNAIKSIPRGRNTYEEAKQFFNGMRRRFGMSERDFDSEIISRGITQTTRGDGAVIPLKIRKTTQRQRSSLIPPPDQDGTGKGLLQGKTLPVLGAIAGGIGGTLVGQPFLGGAAGYGGGDVIRRALADLLGEDLGNEGTIAAPKAQNMGEAVRDIGSGPLAAGSIASLAGPLAVAPFRNILASRAAGSFGTKAIRTAAREGSKGVVGGQAALKQVLPTISPNMTVGELVKQLSKWAPKTYKGTGDIKSTAVAQVLQPTYAAARKLLSGVSPETSMAQLGWHRLYQLRNLLSSPARAIPYAAGSAIGGMAIGKALGRGQ